jgi:hypothetical protein
MALANLANVPGNWQTLQQWTFAHMDHHRQINDAIKVQHGQLLPIYPIDPLTPLNMNSFLYQHQALHKAQNAVLKIDNLDLLGVDWNDEGQRATWIFQNFSEHRDAALALGVG